MLTHRRFIVKFKHSQHQIPTESCFRHPLFDLRGTRKVEIRHTNFHFSSKKVTSKSRKVEVFDLTIVKKLSTFRPKKAKVEKLKSRKVEKLKSRKVEKLKSRQVEKLKSGS